MKQWIWLWAALLVWGLSTGHVMAVPAQDKVVVVVYDDSTSMLEEQQWVRANYALKVLAASLQEKDELYLVWVSNPEKADHYVGRDRIDAALLRLRAQSLNDFVRTTPYSSITTAIQTLEGVKDLSKKRWLVVISDNGFTEVRESKHDLPFVIADAKRATAAKISSAFIELKTTELDVRVAKIWETENAHVERPVNSQDVVEKVAKVAALLNGQSEKGMSVKADGREVGIEAVFPLRGVTLVRQDSDEAKLEEVRWAQQPLPVDPLRNHRFSPNLPLNGMPSMGRVVHVRQSNNGVLPVGQKISLRFGQDVQRLNLTYLPDVAANFSVVVRDAAKRIVAPRKSDGKYLLCDSRYHLEVMLRDEKDSDLLAGRDDQKNFKVNALFSGKKRSFDPGQFVQQFEVKSSDPKEFVVSASMEYPGYFNYEAGMTLVFGGACQKEVTLKVDSGVDDGGVWRSPVDQAGHAQPVRLAVQVDGKPATVDQLAAWLKNLDAGAAAHVLEVTPEAGGFLLRPRADCCLLWWLNPGPGEYPATLVLKTENPRDVIDGSPSVKFVLEPPRSLLDKVLWYGCPFALLALILAIVWYVIRLLRKARFGTDSRLETEDRPKEDYGGVVRPSTVYLREECSAPKRWLWPSKAEVAIVRGLRFIAEPQGDVRVDGRDLGPKHKVPGWVFDRSRVDAPSARERRQEDAAMSDNVVLKIDEGASEVWVRYRA